MLRLRQMLVVPLVGFAAWGAAPALVQGALCALPGDTTNRLTRIGPGKTIYRVWSDVELIDPEGPGHPNRSGMYVFKGVQGPVNEWTLYVFGTGYGDQMSDIEEYTGNSIPSRDAADDAADVAHVIEDVDCFNLDGKTVKITALTPHGHLDHINAEFIDGLLELDADFQLEHIYYHVNEDFLVTCQSKCCEDDLPQPCAVCKRGQCTWYGAPYLEPWTDHPDLESALDLIGNASDDTCTEDSVAALSIAAPPGTMRVVLERGTGHTTGSLDLLIAPDSAGFVNGAVFSGSMSICHDQEYAVYDNYVQHDASQAACPD